MAQKRNGRVSNKMSASKLKACKWAGLRCFTRLLDGQLEGVPAPGIDVYDLEIDLGFRTEGEAFALLEIKTRGRMIALVFIASENVNYTKNGKISRIGRVFYHPFRIGYLSADDGWHVVDLRVNEIYPDIAPEAVGKGGRCCLKWVPEEQETSRFRLPA